MGIFIMFGIMLVVGVVWILCTQPKYGHKDKNYDSEAGIFGFFLVFISIIGSLICGIAILSNNTTTYKEKFNIEMQEEINYLNNTYTCLDSEMEDISVIQYNEQVKEFKTEIAQANRKLNNKFYGCLICKEWNNYNGDEVQYYNKGGQ